MALHGLVQPTAGRSHPSVSPPSGQDAWMCSGRTGRKEGSRSTPKTQKITKGKGWFLLRYFTPLFADDEKHHEIKLGMLQNFFCNQSEMSCHHFKKHHEMRSLLSHSNPAGKVSAAAHVGWLTKLVDRVPTAECYGRNAAKDAPPLQGTTEL